jgi:hypothetical protein
MAGISGSSSPALQLSSSPLPTIYAVFAPTRSVPVAIPSTTGQMILVLTGCFVKELTGWVVINLSRDFLKLLPALNSVKFRYTAASYTLFM